MYRNKKNKTNNAAKSAASRTNSVRFNVENEEKNLFENEKDVSI